MTDHAIVTALDALRLEMLDLKQRAVRLTAVIEDRDRKIAEALESTRQLHESVEHLIAMGFERDAEFAELLEQSRREDDADTWWKGGTE